jgi:hypothetical protein
MTRRKLSSLLIFFLLFCTIQGISTVQVSGAPLSPYIMVIPEETLDPTIEPGMNYTISIYSDYSGDDVYSWEFSLTFNPGVLQMGFNTTDTWIGDNVTAVFTASRAAIAPDSEKIYVDQTLMTRNVNYTITYETGEITFTSAPSLGAEIKAVYMWTGLANGDLISTAKNPSAAFVPGAFNNTAGTLSLTVAYLFYMAPPPPVVSGPGILANITFRVVGYGFSDIILGQDTKLVGPAQPPDYLFPYIIIGADYPPGSTSPPYGSDHIGNGHFMNIRDVAITDLITPTTALLGDTIAINVTVANEGNVTRTFNITVYANTTLVGNQTVASLAEGDITTLQFSWNTTTITAGNYIINATAWLPPDDDPKNNIKTATTEIKTLHDVAVVSLEIPDEANAGDLVTIKVTVANQGTFEENVNLTIYYRPDIPFAPPPAVMNTTTFTMGKRPTSTAIQTSWNTTGLDDMSYHINATITIDLDEDPSDNTLLTPITLNLGHDVSIASISAVSGVFVGETVAVNVTVQNVGGLNETLIDVKVTYGTVSIGSQQVTSLTIGNSVTLSFVWNTTGLNPQIYLVKAEAILGIDGDRTNNQKTALVVVAAPIGTIAGIVKDASGNPVDGASVTCSTYVNTTDSVGSYKLSNVLAGIYTITVSKNGYQPSSQANIRVVAGQTTSLNFTLTLLPTSGRIIGTVTDASTGNPIEGAQVTAGDHSVSTNATGDYSIELAAGTYTLTVSMGGYESSSKTDISVVAGTTTTVDFTLNPNEPLNILPYAAAIVVIVIVIAGIVVYLRKRKKTT